MLRTKSCSAVAITVMKKTTVMFTKESQTEKTKSYDKHLIPFLKEQKNLMRLDTAGETKCLFSPIFSLWQQPTPDV